MRIFVTDHIAAFRVQSAFRWHRHPGSKLHSLLKSALDRVDPAVKASLLSPRVPDPSPYFSLTPGKTAPAALLPVLPYTGAGPQGPLAPGDRLEIQLRRFGRADPHIDRCIEDALEHLDEALVAEQIGRLGPRARAVEIDGPATDDTRLSLRLITPAHLAAGGELPTELTFLTLIKLVRRRLEALCALYGEMSVAASRRFRDELLEHAGDVRCVRARLHRESWPRDASRPDGTLHRHPIVGLLGDLEFEGPLGHFVPTLRAAELLHTGKQTSWGLGRIAATFSPTSGISYAEPHPGPVR